eukprot:m.186210 g.186210  ORF g.186210 m.186210 type:complete len:243 (-) comp10525_c0_seq6:518-1246(-)
MSAVRGVFSLLLLFSLLFMLHVADSLAVCFPCSLLHDQEAATAAAAPVKSEEDATLAPPPAPAPAASAASAASASSSSAAAATTTPSRSGGAGGSSSTGKKRKRETTEDAYRKFEAEHLNDAPHKFAFYRNVLEAQRPDLLLAYGGDKQAIDRLRKVLTFLRVISRDCQKETLLGASVSTALGWVEEPLLAGGIGGLDEGREAAKLGGTLFPQTHLALARLLRHRRLTAASNRVYSRCGWGV